MAATGMIDFQAIFDHAPTAMMIMSPDLTIVDMNRSYLDAVGRSRDAIVDRNLFDAFPSTGETARRLRDSIARVLRTGKPDFLPFLHYPIPVPDESGVTDRYWSASHLPIRGDDGHVDFVLQNTQDVTDLHRLKASRPRLAALAAGSTARSAPRSAARSWSAPNGYRRFERVAAGRKRPAAQPVHARAELHVPATRAGLPLRAGQHGLHDPRRPARAGRAHDSRGAARGGRPGLHRAARQGLSLGRSLRRPADARSSSNARPAPASRRSSSTSSTSRLSARTARSSASSSTATTSPITSAPRNRRRCWCASCTIASATRWRPCRA